MYVGDEITPLPYTRSPSRGVELCGVVEAMYSYEVRAPSVALASSTRSHPTTHPTRSHPTTHVHHLHPVLSVQIMYATHGELAFADRAERIAYNALPATWASPTGGDMWAHQYLQAKATG